MGVMWRWVEEAAVGEETPSGGEVMALKANQFHASDLLSEGVSRRAGGTG